MAFVYAANIDASYFAAVLVCIFLHRESGGRS